MIYIFSILKEQFTHVGLIFRLALYDIKSKYQMHYLGVLWQLFNPLVQVGVYWFVFGIGLRNGAPIGNTPYIVYLLLGLVPWFFVSPTIVQGSNSIYSKVNLVSKMKFPVSILPSITIISNAFNFVVMLIILVIILVLYDINSGVYLLQLPYYMFCLLMFVFAFTLLSSTVSVLIRDFQLLIQSLMKMLFFLTPIFWSLDSFPKEFQRIIELNPFTYLINGFRDTFLGTGWFYKDLVYMFYFWSFTLVLLFIGSILHNNFKNKFVDYL
ncbi:ABC transporter permease [Paucisalibacillus sp. EB02]|uniref:ABC transporter permease n=1 Tax=Paucisalibacillus sp. EB02 TaxID=1347087 RepID=UPI0004AE78D6|nr:ABC transporter permease [Paucisalibacillus sp. EB02]